MLPAPRRWARYRADNGDVWNTRHHEDDRAEFVDSGGRYWRRVAITDGVYSSARAAEEALDRTEEVQTT